MRLRYYLLLLIFPMYLVAQSQGWKQRKADEYYDRYDYDKAISLYESLKEKTPEVYRRMAYAYLVKGDKVSAADSYSRLMEQGDYSPEDVYRYASLLLRLGRYDDAMRWMEKYASLSPDDSRAKRFISDLAYYKSLLVSDESVSLKNVSVNGKFADFGPSYYSDNEIVFTSSRGFGRLWGGNDQPYLDLYVSSIEGDNDLKDMKKFYGEVNKKYHDGPASFNSRGDYMVLTRNIYNEKVRDNKLWLYESKREGDVWSVPRPLHFNSKDYSCGHASLSKDGRRMYFVSDMPGGMGGTDLYYVEKTSDGEWGSPRHLGESVNTEGNEMFPYYDEEEGYLFFASDGLPGLGGLDIFVAKIKEDGSLGKVVNLGAPINSRDDDFGLIFRRDQGFLSSNREGGKGDDDIYSYKDLKKFKDKLRDYYLSGVIKHSETGAPMPGVKVRVYKDGELYKEFVTDDSGSFRYEVPRGVYKIEVEKPGYDKVATDVRAIPDDRLSTDVLSLELKRSDVVVDRGDGKDLCSVRIRPIYYDLDKYYIRSDAEGNLDEIVSLLKRYPEMKLEVISHTDSRASRSYNIRLSKNRTRSAIRYLVSKGISKDRLIGKWKGETELVNGCSDGVDCSEDQHQLNRRTEFKIVGCGE